MTRSKRISQHGTVSRLDVAKRVKSKSYGSKNNISKIATRPPMQNGKNYEVYSVRKIEEHKLKDESSVKNISTVESRYKSKMAKGDTWQTAKLCGRENHSDNMTRSKRISQHGTVSRLDVAKRVKSKSYGSKNNISKIATRPPMQNGKNYEVYSVRKIEEHKLKDESSVKNISTGQTAVRPELIINSFDNVMNRYINGSKNTDWTIM
ncbi:hypothetical protein RR46_00446 [Papilio xuthus]|uniref:Uncharacterized protein n=1 Tax=Papilio xuthus TaxID=66420 RepID=A0A0N1PEM8_PAPXU|nr:hypothetical protein RR46_00446 [Papilio xuthus]